MDIIDRIEAQALLKVNKRINAIEPDFLKYIIEDSMEYVPCDTGELANSAYVENDAIVYGAPYADYVYNTDLNYDLDIHEKATSHWLHKAYEDKKDKWTEKLIEEIKRG